MARHCWSTFNTGCARRTRSATWSSPSISRRAAEMSGPVWPKQPMDRQAIERAVALRAIGFVPEWDPGTTGPGRALRAVFADYIGTVLARLERAPEKNALAFLDLSGLSP